MRADLELLKNQVKHLLKQKRNILGMLNEDHYILKHPKYFDASVGQHFRHILDHFNALMNTTTSTSNTINSIPMVDYDTRKRDTKIESSIQAANESISSIESQVIRDYDMMLKKFVDATFMSDESGKKYSIKSSFQRELSFCAHHAVHHLSFVNLMLTDMGYELPKNIGKAPSTQNHENKECNDEKDSSTKTKVKNE